MTDDRLLLDLPARDSIKIIATDTMVTIEQECPQLDDTQAISIHLSDLPHVIEILHGILGSGSGEPL